MTLTLDLTPELASALRSLAQRAGLDPERLAARALQEYVHDRLHAPEPLPLEETALLQQINAGLPEQTWRRYHQLVGKRQAATLTPDEHQELISLTDAVEIWNARRVELVAELARRRGVALAAMMDELGLTPAPYA